MAITGYGGTLVGSAYGPVTPIQSISGGGITQDVINYRTLGDTTQISNNLFGAVSYEPLEVTCVYDKTEYDGLYDEINTSDTWTATLETGVTLAGTATVTGISGVSVSTDGPNTYTITITPATSWTFAVAP